MKVKIKRLHADAVVPQYSKTGDAGMDLTAISMVYEPVFGEYDSPKDYPGYHYWEYGTGLAVEIPIGFVGLVFPRSSISKTAMIMANSVGVIDSGYRGEIKQRFKSSDLRTGAHYKVGDRVAQLVIIPHPVIEFEEVEELANSERGVGGYGSTGN